MKNKIIYTSLGIFTGCILSLVIYYTSVDIITVGVPFLLGVIVMLVAIGILFILSFGLLKDNIEFKVSSPGNNTIKAILEKVLPNTESDLKIKINRLVSSILIARSISYVSSMIIGLIITVGGITGTALLMRQNNLVSIQVDKLEDQNNLIIQQNIKIDKQNDNLVLQNNLIEAERRGSLVFMFSNLIDGVNRELENDYGNNNKRDLSPQLISRISALSMRLQPYRYLEQDELTQQAFSPERGQLLVTLINSDLDTDTYDEIFSQSSFDYSYIEGVNFDNRYFQNISLRNSKLVNVRFHESNLVGADLSSSNLNNTKFLFCNMKSSKLGKLNMDEVSFHMSELNDARTDTIHFFQKIEESGEAVNDATFLVENFFIQELNGTDSDLNYQIAKTNNIDFKKYIKCREIVSSIVSSSQAAQKVEEYAITNNLDLVYSLTNEFYWAGNDFVQDSLDWYFNLKFTNDMSPVYSNAKSFYFDSQKLELYSVEYIGDVEDVNYEIEIKNVRQSYNKQLLRKFESERCSTVIKPQLESM